MPRDASSALPRLYATFRYCDAARMIDWLCDAFGFTVAAKFTDGDKVAHSELSLGSDVIMIGSVADDAYGAMVGSPGANGGKSVYIAVDDCDAAFRRAEMAGARILQEPQDRDYGSREFICADPEGVVWSIGTYRPNPHGEA